MEKSEILNKLETLKGYFESGDIPRIENHEVHPDLAKDSWENYVYFTLPVATNFQRNSPAMWQSAYQTYMDESTRYLFSPSEVVKRDFETLQRDLTKHKLALQPNKHVQIWQRISQTLHEQFAGDPRLIIKSNQSCVTRIKNHLRENQKLFPYLNGPKLANYWLYILENFTDVKLRNRHKISIIPDTHIKQASRKLGITDSDDPKHVERAWFELLQGTQYIPIDFHSTLWHWSRNGFEPGI